MATTASPTPTQHHYSELWDGLKLVADQAEESKEWMTRLTRFFKEKAELDKHYSKTLKKMVEKLTIDSSENATFQQFITSFRGLNSTLAVNFEILSAKIEEQVYKPLSHTKESHATHIKKIVTESIRLTKLYNTAYENLEKTRNECMRTCKELSDTKKGLNQQDDVNMIQDVFSAFKSDIPTLSKKALAADQKYMAAVKHMRGFRSQFDTSMAHLLDQFQVMEQERLTQSIHHLRHYMSVQSGMLASNTKNLSAVVSVLDRIDIEGDIQAFIQKHKTDKKPPPLPEYEMFPGHPNYRKDVTSFTDDSESELSPRDSEYASDDADDAPPKVVKKPVVKKVVVKSPATSPQSSITSKSAPTASTTAKKPPPPKSAPPNGKTSTPTATTKPPPPSKKSPVVSASVPPTGAAAASMAMAVGTATVEAASAAASSAAIAIKSALKKTITQADVAVITAGATSAGEEVIARRESQSRIEEKTPSRLKAEEELLQLFTKITGHEQTETTEEKEKKDTTLEVKEREGCDLTDQEWEQAHTLFTTPDGRAAFAYVLNKQRNHNTGLRLSPLSFSLLARLTLDFLDEAKRAMHVHPAQLTMIMSQTFYRENDDDEQEEKEKKEDDRTGRIYLVTAIKDHPIWKDIRFWEEAFFDSFHDKMAKHTKVARWHSDAEQAESLHTQRQIVFSSLGTFAHNMMDFGIDPKMICSFVEKMASINELEAEQITLLRQLSCFQLAAPMSPTGASDLDDDDLGDVDSNSGFQSADSASDADTPINANVDFPIPATGRPKRIMTAEDGDDAEDETTETPPDEQSAPTSTTTTTQLDADDADWDHGDADLQSQTQDAPTSPSVR